MLNKLKEFNYVFTPIEIDTPSSYDVSPEHGLFSPYAFLVP